jgi:hypothetical protein
MIRFGAGRPKSRRIAVTAAMLARACYLRCSGVLMPKKTSLPNTSPTGDITNSAFSFVLRAGEFLNSLNNRPVSDVAGLQEVKHISERFIEYACIPASKQKEFLFEITRALREWALGQINYGDYYHEYIKMRYDANACCTKARSRLRPYSYR